MSDSDPQPAASIGTTNILDAARRVLEADKANHPTPGGFMVGPEAMRRHATILASAPALARGIVDLDALTAGLRPIGKSKSYELGFDEALAFMRRAIGLDPPRVKTPPTPDVADTITDAIAEYAQRVFGDHVRACPACGVGENSDQLCLTGAELRLLMVEANDGTDSDLSDVPASALANAWGQLRAASGKDITTTKADATDAARYRRLQVLGVPKETLDSEMLRFSNLDTFVDGDIRAHPSRGEAAARCDECDPSFGCWNGGAICSKRMASR